LFKCPIQTIYHQGDAATLERWLANKTPQVFLACVTNKNNGCVVAEENDHLLGEGMLGRCGDVLLLYLLPGMQLRGIDKVIYLAMEENTKAGELWKMSMEAP
jgi:hypothetical protein